MVLFLNNKVDYNSNSYPQAAASITAMQNASVSEVFRKISPCTKT